MITPRPRRSPVSRKSLPFSIGIPVPETPLAYYEALQRWKDAQNLTAHAMSKVLGVSHVTVGKWLDGKNISRRYWSDIRRATGMYFDPDSAMEQLAVDARPATLNDHGEDYLVGRTVTLPADARQIIRTWLEAKDFTPRGLANMIGYDKPQVLKDIFWDGKRREVTVEKLAAVIRQTEFPVDLLPAGSDVRQALEQEPPRRHMTRPIPALVEARAQELPSLQGYANAEAGEIFAHVPTDGKQWGCVQIIGESMGKAYPEGTLVAGHIVEGAPGHHLQNGADAAIRYTDMVTGEPVFVFKRLKQRDAEGRLVLESLDPYIDDITVPEKWVDWSFEALIVDKTHVIRRSRH